MPSKQTSSFSRSCVHGTHDIESWCECGVRSTERDKTVDKRGEEISWLKEFWKFLESHTPIHGATCVGRSFLFISYKGRWCSCFFFWPGLHLPFFLSLSCAFRLGHRLDLPGHYQAYFLKSLSQLLEKGIKRFTGFLHLINLLLAPTINLYHSYERTCEVVAWNINVTRMLFRLPKTDEFII